MSSKTIIARTAVLAGLISALATTAGADVIVDGGFESTITPPLNLPNSVGQWSGDLTQNVLAQDGITPFEGARMIQFVNSTPYGGAVGPIGSELWQIVDLSAYDGSGPLQATAQGWFNRVGGDDNTDDQFSLVLSAYSGAVSDFASMWMNSELALTEGFAYTDSNVQTWEMATTSMIIPDAADFLVLRVTATENVWDDADNEFDGHYGDAFSLDITEIPAPAGAATMLLGVGGLARRRRRSAN